MAPPEANIEMVVMARNLPNDCIDFSILGGSTRDETAVAILLSKHQRAKIVEVHRQGLPIIPDLTDENPSYRSRHGERSEAIQVASVACGLVRRFAPRNDAPRRESPSTRFGITSSLRRTNWRWMRKIPRLAKPWLCCISKHNGGARGAASLSIGSNIGTSLSPGETL